MNNQSIGLDSFIPIPNTPQFISSPIIGVAPTHSSINNFQKWNLSLKEIIKQAIDDIKTKKEGFCKLIKVSFKNQWSEGILCNFTCQPIDEVCLQILQSQLQKISTQVELTEKWLKSQKFEIGQNFLKKIFRYYTSSFAEQFRHICQQIKDRINDKYSQNDFFKSLNFSVSQIAISFLQKTRYDYTHPNKTDQLSFKEQSQKKYGLNVEDHFILNLLLKPDQSITYQQYLKNKRNLSSEQLRQIINRYIKIVKLKDTSIRQLNMLVGNEEEQLTYRQSQIQNLTVQIKKLISRNKIVDELEEKVKKYEKQICQKQKSIVQLNKLISNQEEELIYRENEVEILTEQIKKLLKLKSMQ